MNSNGSKSNVLSPQYVYFWILVKMNESKLGTSSLTKLKMKVGQIWKIRPFFQSARQADSKNAKIFEKSSFFEKICLRKPAWFTGRQIFFVPKVAFDECMIKYKFKKNRSIRFKNWKSHAPKLNQLKVIYPRISPNAFTYFLNSRELVNL